MQKTEVTDVRIKACRPSRFKAGSELSGKVNLVTLNIDHTEKEDSGKECLDVDLKWEETELIEADTQ